LGRRLMAAAFVLGRDMNYQQAFVEHYKAVRARIVNPKLKMMQAAPIVALEEPEQIPEKEPEPEKLPRSSDPRVNILRDCANEYGCTVEDIMGASRRTNVMFARRKAIWLIYARGRMSKAAVGRYLNKDHTTVVYALRKYEKSLAQGEAK